MIITGDIGKKNWIAEGLHTSHTTVYFYFSFRDNQSLPITFDDFSFGYTLYFGNQKISEIKKPTDGIKYISTDQEVFEVFAETHLGPEKTYTLSVWAKNSGETWKKDIEFTMPKLIGPYPSWIFNYEEQMWESPVPYPDIDDEIFYWNEEIQQWTTES